MKEPKKIKKGVKNKAEEKMKKTPGKSILIDRIHKGIVLTCVGITLYGLVGFGSRWYNYFTVLRPEAKRRELLEKEELLTEGAASSS